MVALRVVAMSQAKEARSEQSQESMKAMNDTGSIQHASKQSSAIHVAFLP
jgi:hypothetical protein